MGRKVKLQKICLKKYFRHKDEEKETFEVFTLHPKVERIISEEVKRINEEPK